MHVDHYLHWFPTTTVIHETLLFSVYFFKWMIICRDLLVGSTYSLITSCSLCCCDIIICQCIMGCCAQVYSGTPDFSRSFFFYQSNEAMVHAAVICLLVCTFLSQTRETRHLVNHSPCVNGSFVSLTYFILFLFCQLPFPEIGTTYGKHCFIYQKFPYSLCREFNPSSAGQCC